MSLKIQMNTDGTFRSTWWGRLSVKGKRRETNLSIPIEGTIPVDSKGNLRLAAKGDDAFEKSRKAAQKAFEKWRRECQKDPAELQAKAYKARTGEDIEGLPLSKLYADWKCNVIRAKTPSPAWDKMVEKWFARFAKFCQDEARKHKKRCETTNDVTPALASAWFSEINAKYTWETVLKMKHTLSKSFTRLQARGLTRVNPFGDMQLQGGSSGANRKVPRKALSEQELEKLFTCAKEDAELYPLVVAAACTGMRLGDVCNLKWSDVDLQLGLIDCATAKTGARVTIPILGTLSDVLTANVPVPGDGTPPSPYVFPAAQAQYARNKHRIIQAVKPLFARAVFGDNEEAATEVLENGETTRELAEVIDGAGFTDHKRNRLIDVYKRFKAGERCSDIAADLNVARSQVSMDLREIEQLTGETLRPMAAKSAARKTRLDLIEKTRQERKVGQRAACIYGWHSFRHTFVVLALKAGVPVEDVRLIVGHGEASTTIDNYYNPSKKIAAESLRKGLKGSVLDSRKKRIAAPVPTTSSVDDLIAGLTKNQRIALARKLLG